MKKFAVSVAICLAGVAVLVVGILIHDQSTFDTGTVQSQLASQGITFTPVAGLTAAQRAVPCLVQNAEKPLLTGPQAECYANFQIALDLKSIDGGKTYAQASYAARLAEEKVAALEASDPTSPNLPALNAQAAALEGPASTLFQGESLRGMLLTTYAFDHLGDLGNDAADVLFLLSAIVFISGLVVAFMRLRQQPKDMLLLGHSGVIADVDNRDKAPVSD